MPRVDARQPATNNRRLSYHDLSSTMAWSSAVADRLPGHHDRYVYDAVGNQISAKGAQGTTDARTTQVRYDALGRVTQTLSARAAAHHRRHDAGADRCGMD